MVLYMIVAWRIAWLMRRGRSRPHLGPKLMFKPDKWKATYILNKLKISTTPPMLDEMVRQPKEFG